MSKGCNNLRQRWSRRAAAHLPSHRSDPLGSGWRARLVGCLLVGTLLWTLSACLVAPLEAGTVTPSSSPEPSETPTPTIVWFPPTATPTPLPTLATTATPASRPSFGALLLADDFSEPALWSQEAGSRGTLSLTGTELTIALVQARSYFYSVRSEPDLGSYYAEITASPNLCRGLDEYGLLLHYLAPGDFYRFSLSCDGQVRLDRLMGGFATSPQAWMRSAMVPSAAPSSTRLGVWIDGKTMRFYLNGELQFEAQDAYLYHGRLGVFARSAGENAVTVSFSELEIYQIGQ